MSPLFIVVLVLLVIIALLVLTVLWAVDRIRSMGFGMVQPPTRTISSLPLGINLPTAHRRKHPSRWS